MLMPYCVNNCSVPSTCREPAGPTLCVCVCERARSCFCYLLGSCYKHWPCGDEWLSLQLKPSLMRPNMISAVPELKRCPAVLTRSVLQMCACVWLSFFAVPLSLNAEFCFSKYRFNKLKKITAYHILLHLSWREFQPRPHDCESDDLT